MWIREGAATSISRRKQLLDAGVSAAGSGAEVSACMGTAWVRLYRLFFTWAGARACRLRGQVWMAGSLPGPVGGVGLGMQAKMGGVYQHPPQ